MTENTKTIIIIVLFAFVFLLVGIYFANTNYGFLYHQSNITAHSVNPIREKCISEGGKYITGWIGGYPSFFCVPK
jgi:UDP-N-acetylglucosamine:LPS N-acetylglucosamine transferase